MAIELSTVAAGLPMAASFAMAGGFVALREGRRRSSLNAALHELRRPLQALCLSLPASLAPDRPLASSLELAVAAVERLDREINGEQGGATAAAVSLRPLAEEAVGRWRRAANGLDRSLDLRWWGDDAVLCGDRFALSQALDNLISNALRHGSGAVTVAARVEARALRLTVRDQGRAVAPATRRFSWQRLGGRARHGHGLALVRGTAAQHGGSFRLSAARAGTEARLLLPLGEEGG
jgi:signal transduction histidine kinase